MIKNVTDSLTSLMFILEIISHDDTLDNVEISDDEEDKHDDAAAEKILENGTITAVFEVDPYLSCPNKGCNNTKLITIEEAEKYMMKCKNCKGLFSASTANNYVRASVLYEHHDNTSKRVALFLPQIKQIFESRGTEFKISYDREQMLTDFYTLIPIQGKFKIFNNTVRNVVLKRDIVD